VSDPLQYLDEQLAALKREDLLREPAQPLDPAALSFCSNDYLGLARLPAIAAAPSGSGASRLIAGERAEHRDLERALADWLGLEDALVFTSGYAANVGALSALAGPGDLVVSDALNHASIIDGIRLSRARVAVVPHLDLGALDAALARRETGRAFVAVESYFSMDADGPDLVELRKICDRRGAALLVDEAHALGVLGPGGRGRCAEAGVVPDVLVGTLGKAFGAQGAFVAGRRSLRAWLWNRARSFVFSTGLAPSSAAAATRSLGIVRESPEMGRKVVALATRLREKLLAGGLAPLGFGHVVPIVLGDADHAMKVAERLRADGFAVQAVRPPTVPTGTSRIRLTITAAHSADLVDAAADAVSRAVRR
jgi:8-amino-7-oxononanoate synthase